MAQEISVEDLIEQLQQFTGRDLKVRFAHQPSYPFALAIGEVIEVDGVVYIAEESQFGYLPSNVTEELGWR